MSGSNTKKCFVITPIGDEMSPIRRHIEGVIDAAIEPALGDKFEICVSHRIYVVNGLSDLLNIFSWVCLKAKKYFQVLLQSK